MNYPSFDSFNKDSQVNNNLKIKDLCEEEKNKIYKLVGKKNDKLSLDNEEMSQQINNLNLEIETLKSKLTASLTLVKTYQEKLTSIKNIEFSSTSVQTVPLHLFSQSKSTSTEGEEKLIKSTLCFSTYPVLSFEFDCTNNILNGDLVNVINNENKLSIIEINSIDIIPKMNKSNKPIQKKSRNVIKPKQTVLSNNNNNNNNSSKNNSYNMKLKKNKNENNNNISILSSSSSFTQQTKNKTKSKAFHSNIINTVKTNNNNNNNNNVIKKNKEINENENSLDLIESIIENKNEFDNDFNDCDDDEFSEEKGYKNDIFSDGDDLINGEGDELSLLNDESYSEGNTSMVMSLWDLVSEIENDLTN